MYWWMKPSPRTNPFQWLHLWNFYGGLKRWKNNFLRRTQLTGHRSVNLRGFCKIRTGKDFLFCSTPPPLKAPMCCVMPPNSWSTILDFLRWSRSVVLPWSTWPMMVTTAGRFTRTLGSGGGLQGHKVSNRSGQQEPSGTTVTWYLGQQGQLSGRASVSWSKGLGFEFWQENFF